MLYPDLGRLSLMCPTGTPGTNQAESGGSNDSPPPPPPPPPPQAAGPAQREALGKRDIVEAILGNLGSGNYEDACRVAARWCSLNSEHRAACQTHQPWTDLAQAVFPGSRTPNPRNREPTHPKDWFFFLCNRHARLVVLRDLVNRIFITEVFLVAQLRYNLRTSDARILEKRRARQRQRHNHADLIPVAMSKRNDAILAPGTFPRGWGNPGGGGWNEPRNQQLQVKQWMIEQELERAGKAKRTMDGAVQKGAVVWATREHPEKWVGELAQLEAYMRGLYPNRQPLL